MKKTLFLILAAVLMLGASNARSQSRIIKFDNPKLTVFLAPKNIANGKAVVACPGGGYTHLATNHEGYDWAPFYNEHGYALAVLEYRMPEGDRNIPMSDVRRAFEIMADSAAVWGLDPARIGIMGSSAGGHLASTIATHPTPTCRPAFQVLFYPVISLDNSITHKGTRKGFLGDNPTQQEVDAWSSQNNVTKDTPQAFIVLSSDDRAVPAPNSLGYFRALIDNGVPASMFLYPTGGHGWGYKTSFPHRRQMLTELSHFLDSYNKANPSAKPGDKK